MADELDATLDKPSEAEQRIKQLSGKVKEEAEAKAAAEAARQAAEEKAAIAERERDFYASFSDIVASNPSAKDFKDDIKSKVLSGYTPEDATFAVLGKAGKLNQTQEVSSPAGGSATTNVTQNTGTKSIKEMTPEERAAAFQEATKNGDIFWQ